MGGAIVAGLLAVTVASAAPTSYTRVAGTGNWSLNTLWSPSGHPGLDAGDTATFGLAAGYDVTMDANKTVDSVIVTNTGSWRWLKSPTSVLTVNNLFRYAGSGTGYFGSTLGDTLTPVQFASIVGPCKVQVESGTLHLMSFTNSYSGGTEINGGTLHANVNRRNLAPNTYLGSGPVNIGATNGPDRDAALWISCQDVMTYPMAITNRSGNAGRSIIGRSGITGTSTAGLTLSGGLVLQKAIELHDTIIQRNTWSGGNGELLLTGPISGTGNLTKDGFGWVRLQGVNSYAGDTTVKRGVLTLENASSTVPGNYVVKCGLLMAAAEASLGNAANTLTLGDSGTFGGFGPYNVAAVLNRNITLTGNGGFLQSYFNGSYRQSGTGILSGSGKLIVAMPAGAQFTNNNTYAGGTVIVDGTVDSSGASPNNNNLFGAGNVDVLFYSALNLRGNGNVASGKKILVTRTGDTATGTRAALRLYAGVTTVPTIDPASGGILMLNSNSSTVLNDLVATSAPQLGNGYMIIGADYFTFNGASLQANLDNVYRLGALNGQISLNAAGNGVLTGARSVEIGQLPGGLYAYAGIRIDRRGYARTYDANDYSGTTTVFQASQFIGDAQTTVGNSPFGSTNAPVVLKGGELYLVGVATGKPVNKGELTVDGYGQLTLGSTSAGNQLTFASLNRVGSSVLYLYDPNSPLGSAHAQVRITAGLPVPVNGMLPPYFLQHTVRNFMNYTANGFTNAVYTHTSLVGVDSTSIVNLPGDATVSGTVNVYAMKTVGILGGTATDLLRIHSGGLILNASKTHTVPIEFVSEGVIQDDLGCTFSGKLTGSSGLVKMGIASTALNGDSSATLSGPITINQGTLRLNAVGSIAQTSPITLNGGALHVGPASTWNNPIALGTLGGALNVQPNFAVIFAGNITGGAGTGPLTMSGAASTIAGTGNTYQGGTIIGQGAGKVTVAATSSLGTGNLTVDSAGNLATPALLLLLGNSNVSPTARVYLVGAGTMIQFRCPSPSIGSLEGNGDVRLSGSDSDNQAANCRLTVGGNNLDTEFFGSIRDVSSTLTAGVPASDQLAKIGTGNLTLWGENSYSGGTILSNGTLTVNNWINTDGWVAVYPQGTLDGIGTVGVVSNFGGKVRGSVNMTSLVLATNTCVFEAVLNGSTPVTEYGQVTTASGLNLNGSTLAITLNFAPAIGQSFTILNNTSGSGITGTFACGSSITASYGGRNYSFRIDYNGGTGNDIVLTRLVTGTIMTIR
jgi:autotransporter-associated beta strand protein